MPEEKNKTQIITRLQTERRRLDKVISRLSREEMLHAQVVGEWTIKDVLAHLADWEAHMLVWVAAGRSGDPVEHPDPGLTWKQLDEFNQRVYAAHCDQPLDEVLAYYHSAHEQFMAMVEAMPEDEMLKPGCYAFLGKSAVYDWLKQYAAHDLWGKTHILKWMKIRTPTA